MRILERLRRPAPPEIEPAEIEHALAGAFAFLVDEYGFELARRERFEDGAGVAYKNRGAGTGILVEAHVRHGVWGWVGTLDAAGRLRPLDRDTVDFHWRDLKTLGFRYPETDDLFLAILRFGAAVRGARRLPEVSRG